MAETYLGKITHVEFGLTDRGSLALTFYLEGKEWSEVDGKRELLTTFGTFTIWNSLAPDFDKNVEKLLHKAKKSDVMNLAGVPIRITIENNTLRDWEILEEVL